MTLQDMIGGQARLMVEARPLVPYDHLTTVLGSTEKARIIRSDTQGRVNRMFGKPSFEEFMCSFYGKEPCLVRTDVDPTESLVTWAEFEDVLVSQRPTWPRLRLLRDGTSVPPARFLDSYQSSEEGSVVRLRVAEIIEELRAGATLIFNGFEEAHSQSRQLACAIEHVFSERVNVEAYVNFQTKPSFGMHWDGHDAFMFQIYGEKVWHLSPPTRAHPVRGDDLYSFQEGAARPDPSSDQIREVSLSPGYMLYMPRGWWHNVFGRGEPTMHLAFVLPRRTGLDYLAWLRQVGRELPVARREVLGADAGLVDEYANELLALLSSVSGGAGGTAYREYVDGMAPARPRVSLPNSALTTVLPATDGTRTRLEPTCPRQLVVRQRADQCVTFSACGRAYVASERALPLLDLIFGKESTELDAILGGTDDASAVREAVTELLLDGLLTVRTTS